MSTIPNRPARLPLGGTPARPKVRRPPRPGRASFAYGYRDVHKKLPDGRYRCVRIPLTLEDVLHPGDGDVHLLSDPHTDDCLYLREVLKSRYVYDPSVVVFSDCGIYWDVPRLRHHSPDIAVIFGVKRRKDWRTFRVKTEKVRPALIIEVTSPDTRVNDVKTKVEEYARARVPHYVIADEEKEGELRRLTLKCHRLVGTQYEEVALGERGRAWLEPIGLWLGVRVNPETGGDRLVLIDPATNREIGDYTAINRARLAAVEQAEAEAQARAIAEAQTRAAEAQTRAAIERAEAEGHARAIAEARIRELEAQLGRRKRR